MPRSGQLRHQLKIQRRICALDDFGQQQDRWEDFLALRGNMRPVSGTEKVGSLSLNPSLTHTIAVRYRPALCFPLELASYRVLFGARILNIESVRNLEERNRWVVLNCVEGSRDGQ